jgi:hypothetical protein
LPPVGSTVSFSGVGGTTQMNGNTYTVTANATGQFTLSVDSSGFGAFTSGGTATYVNSMTLRNELRLASKESKKLVRMTLNNFHYFLGAGGEWPSHLTIASSDSAWSALDPDIWAPDSTQWEAFKLFASGMRQFALGS